MKSVNHNNSNNFTISNLFNHALRSAITVGFIVGLIEAALVAVKVLFSNEITLEILSDVVIFVTAAVALFVLFMVVIAIVMSGILFFPIQRLLKQVRNLTLQAVAWGLNFFAAILFTLIFWVNLNSTRSLFSGTSLLINFAVLIGAALLAALGAYLAVNGRLNSPFLKGAKPRPVVLGWIVLFMLAFVQNLSSDPGLRSDKPNVIFLIVDTLRADRLGCYGYEKETSPAIDEIAHEGVIFEQAYVQWASSLPSHASMMTSMYPYQHGAFPNGKSLNPELQTLAKILKAHGYSNGAFVTNSLVGNQYNFDLGFDAFFDLAKLDYSSTPPAAWYNSLNLWSLKNKITHNDIFTELSVAWIEQNQEGPFFLWTQWLHPHAPYTPPEEFLQKFASDYHGNADGSMKQIDKIIHGELELSEADKQYYEALYDAEVAFSDYQISRIIDKLRDLNLLENSIVIITGDHGENLYEHRMEYGHYGVYDSSIKIPLIFYFPEKMGKNLSVPQVVESIDIAPTILALIDIPEPQQFRGRNLLPLVRNESSDWPSVARSVMFRKERNFFAFRENEWKIILDVQPDETRYELYHIPSDPHELNNRFEMDTDVAARYKDSLETWLERDFQNQQLVYEPGNFFREDFDKKTIERLRSLGYIK